MISKLKYVPSIYGFINDFHSVEGEVCGINIKEIKHKEKTGKKSLIPVPKRITTWGIFLHIRIQNGDQYDAIWNIDKSYTMGDCDIPIKKIDKKYINRYEIASIPTVLRAVGVNEWVDVIGSKVIIKSLNGAFPPVTGFGISPLEEESGRWFYPDYFEIHMGMHCQYYEYYEFHQNEGE